MLCSNVPDEPVGAVETTVHFNIMCKQVFQVFQEEKMHEEKLNYAGTRGRTKIIRVMNKLNTHQAQ